MRVFVVFAAAAMLFAATTAAAHELRHTVAHGDAVVIAFSYPDGTPFDFEQYEIYREGGGAPFQVGRTDALGRVAFVPSEAGTWRIKAFTEDGHGADFTFETGTGGTGVTSEQPAVNRYTKLFVGVAVILGIFGFLSLFLKRRRTA